MIKTIKLLTWLGLLLSLLTFASRLGQFHWTLDLLSHYHIQYAVGIALCLLGLLLLRQMRPVYLILLIALLFNLSLIVPFFLPADTQRALAEEAGTNDNKPLRVMAMNISTSDAGYGKVIAHIRQQQPDMVFMSEVREDLVSLLKEELANDYPYLHAEPSRFTLGIAFLSRQPFRDIQTVSASSEGPMRRKYLRAEIDWQGAAVTLVGIHPLPPMNGGWAVSRNNELQMMTEVAQQAKQPFVLLGDLNASPWSWPMRNLMAESDLRYAMQGYGIGLTWRLGGVLLGAPLDYVLVSPEWEVFDYAEEGDVGSDHLPIQADLVLRRES